MTTTPDPPTAGRSSGLWLGILARLAQVVFVFVLQAVLLFACAGRIRWTWAWVYLGICLASFGINGAILLRRSPETIAERGRPKEFRGWDIVLSTSWSLLAYLALPIVAGLDLRFGWSGTGSLAWHLTGAVALAAGLGLGAWAMIANAFFSTVVRIQTDRGHAVCSSGPYAFVRHPGYVGFSLMVLATPLLLGSWWAEVPAVAATALLVVRTALEDGVLRAELPGYGDYARAVRYRLVPGIW